MSAAYENHAVPSIGHGDGQRVGRAELTPVFAVDEQPIFRRGLASVLAGEGGYHWLGESASGTEALRLAPGLRPDLVFIDLLMPGMDGIETLQSLKMIWPGARFVLMASRLAPVDLRRVLATGVSCLHKRLAASELLAALRSLRSGQRVFSPALLVPVDDRGREAALRADLTPREQALLGLMAQGLDNRSIAVQLGISVPTVKFHVTNIMSKLQADNRTAAVLAGLRQGLIQLEPERDPPAVVGSED